MITGSRGFVAGLAVLALVLIIAASVLAILADDGGSPEMVTSLRGEKVELYGGHGVYQHDSTFKAVIMRGYDWANLAVCLPLTALAISLYWRKRLRGQLLLAAIFAYLAYNYTIGVMGNAYNNLFLVWTALLGVGLWGIVLVAGTIDIPALPRQLEPRFPARAVAVYLVFLAVFLFAQYIAEILNALNTGAPPVSLKQYTTLELAALELAIMIPLHLVGGILLWRRKAWGYFLAVLLTFTAGMTFISLSVGQVLLYFSLGRGELFDVLIPVALAVIAVGIALIILARMKGPDTASAVLPAGDRGNPG